MASYIPKTGDWVENVHFPGQIRRVVKVNPYIRKALLAGPGGATHFEGRPEERAIWSEYRYLKFQY